jgi:chromatin assembly factor 1 subunit B
MKIETPQISWHGCESDKGRNAPLLSCSMIESGLEDLEGTYSQVLATAGNDSVVNLWKLSFNNDHNAESSSSSHHGVHVVEDVPPNRTNSGSVGVGPSSNTTVNQNNSIVKIQHLTSLKRHERSVNALKFSPDGLTLATAGDGGSIVLWSIPHDKRGGSNGQHFWSLVSKESDVECRILPSGGSEGVTCEDIFDLQWSPCSSRFVVCSLDHCLLVFENQHHADGTNGGIGSSGGSTSLSVTSGWKCVASARDHTHYVQGVAYDPLNVYVCSQASDRSVRVYSQKEASAKNKNKFDLQKEATIKFWPNAPSDEKKEVSGETTESSAGSTIKKAARRNHLFAEEATVESFFRRLAWTADGAFLIAPAGIMPKRAAEGDSAAPSDDSNNASSFGTYLFARHCFDRPAAALPGLTKVSHLISRARLLLSCYSRKENIFSKPRSFISPPL